MVHTGFALLSPFPVNRLVTRRIGYGGHRIRQGRVKPSQPPSIAGRLFLVLPRVKFQRVIPQKRRTKPLPAMISSAPASAMMTPTRIRSRVVNSPLA